MAIARVKHIDIFFTQDKKANILSLIQRLGVMQLMQLKEVTTSIPKEQPPEDLEKVQEAIDYLESISVKKRVLARRPAFGRQELDKILEEFDARWILQHLNNIKARLKVIQQELERLANARDNLIPWQELSLHLRDIASGRYVEIILGIVGEKQLPLFKRDIRENNLNLYFELVNQKDNLAYLLIIYLKEESPAVYSLLKKYSFHHIILPEARGTPQEILLEIDANIAKLRLEKEELIKEAGSLIPQKLKLMALADLLNNERILKKVSLNLFQTGYVSLLTGWIKEKDLARLKSAISSLTDLEIIERPPRSDEEVPVDLVNKPLVQPFETITRIYGMPKYNELDPTPFLAPFFFLYFGLCLSDVGYGLLLVLLCGFILKRFKMGEDAVKFFRLFLFCGISTIIIGALTGSWFGNLWDLLAEGNKIFLPLKKFKDSLILLDPLREPTKLLGIALGLGILQVWFGNIVAAIGNIKNKRYLDVILDQLTMLILLFGLTGLGLIFLRFLGDARINLFKFAALLGAIGLILTQGRSEKGWGGKLFYGLYNLYNAFSGYLSDILSYSRLWALGMVTGVMAMTINLISIQFSQLLPNVIPFLSRVSFIKVIASTTVLVVIFLFGHIVSFLMNILGAFVHPVRLQFVEFFSKFFKSGGNAFRPFKIETRYITIE